MQVVVEPDSDAGIHDVGADNNQPPAAIADQANAEPAVATYIRVLDNDSDPDDDRLKISEVTQPQNGQVALSFADTTITYESRAGYTGNDTFQYTVSDGNGGTATAQVTVSVSMPTLPILIITAPQDSATIMGGNVTISFTADCAFSPPSQNRNGCHGHMYLDNNPWPGNRNGHYRTQSISLTGLSAGQHTFRLVLIGNSISNNDRPYSPSIEDSVTFTVTP